MTGRGAIDVSSAGLTVEGTLFGSGPQIPPWASLVVLAVALLVFATVEHAERVLTPATALVVGGILWLRYRAEYGRTGTFQVSWSEIEHVVRLASNTDVLAVVLARPLAGRGSPEQFFFAPVGGVEELVAALREHGPATLTVDVESALRPLPSAAGADEGTDLWP